jgi:hypothetical protein
VLACVALAFLAVSCGSSSSPSKPLSSLGALQPPPGAGKLGAELVPIPAGPNLAPPNSTARKDRSVDGITCEFNPVVAFHVHAHLTLFVNGQSRRLPAGIGFWPPLGPENYRNGQFGVTGGNCWTWLSTRYPDGLVHIEAPEQRSFVLGELFDIWGQPLSRTQLGPAHGPVIAIVDGSVWTGDPRKIPLGPHTQIQLESGTPLVAPQTIAFPGAF